MGAESGSEVVLADVVGVEGDTEVVMEAAVGVVVRVVVTAEVVAVGEVDEGPEVMVVSPTSAAAAASQSATKRVADSPWGVATAEA